MNRFPYNSGHIMVVPRAHTADLMALPASDYQATCELLRQSVAILTRELGAHGCGLGMNLGRVAGAGHRSARSLPHRAALERRHELHARRR